MKKIFLYPFWLRFWHWLNASLFLILILSGLSLHYADPKSSVVSFNVARVLHNLSGIFLTLNYLFFVIQSIFTGNIKHYIPKIKGFLGRLLLQTRYYGLGIFIGEKHPYESTVKHKFNPLQQISYLWIMFFFMPLIVVSGWALLFPKLAPEQLFGMGGVWPMALLHTIVGFILSVFMVGHIYLATTGETITELYKSMITGWHIQHESDEAIDKLSEVYPTTREFVNSMRKRIFPIMFYNPITIAGAIISLISLLTIIFLMIINFFLTYSNPYLGIVTFIILPSFLIFGLLLIAWGAIRENRRILRKLDSPNRLPIIDLNNPKHQLAILVFTVGTILIATLSIFGSFKAYEYTDSDEFCGKVCHKVMSPEFTAYNDSPHSRVGCVKCHIGSGADWYVRAKLSGIYQVYSVIFNKYSKPIPTPIENLRPAQGTCEQCHWPKQFYNDIKKDINVFLSDEKNTEYNFSLLIKIGGGNKDFGNSTGIHLCMNIANEIKYYATDKKRLEIPWIKSKSIATGKETVYRDTNFKISNEAINKDELRIMDCIDCHNRPSHQYKQPNEVLNAYLSSGKISQELPYIKNIGVQALENYAKSKETSFDDIKKFILNFYKQQYPLIYETNRKAIDNSIIQLTQIYQRNYFPEMNVSWKQYPINIGHMHSPGCYRCHDGKHINEEGKVLTMDCNACHLIVSEKIPGQELMQSTKGLNFIHPGGVDKIADTKMCTRCHGAFPKNKNKSLSEK